MTAYVRNQPTRFGLNVQLIVGRKLFDTSRLAAERDAAVQKVAQEVVSFWMTEAGQRMKGRTRDTYLGRGGSNLQVRITDKGNAVISLLGKYAADLEYGYGSFEMQPGFAASPKLKKGKLVIPIDPGAGVFKIFSVDQLSNPNAWNHPGFSEGYRITDEVIPFAKERLKEEVTAAVQRGLTP